MRRSGSPQNRCSSSDTRTTTGGWLGSVKVARLVLGVDLGEAVVLHQVAGGDRQRLGVHDPRGESFNVLLPHIGRRHVIARSAYPVAAYPLSRALPFVSWLREWAIRTQARGRRSVRPTYETLARSGRTSSMSGPDLRLHDYADLCVMPTFGERCCWPG